ncbi:hypothetical protein GNI_174650 [Gregarina niphandrodes]|uniref:Uncharacterized protein n=1 Tax=Gregarina niphandrodes TaxID=110365 RepID=A0A023AYP1_GRENI|nr:hypothetical protein GNI_174650 [Gregarina niphandrodes]EZG43385.1 hypothetical protein GNI_174650 [Gregarina niphandrodes]|eukprot:XP_011133386.1 hypothetical protein GNI_174650 [Gregarina niphandrodes]
MVAHSPEEFTKDHHPAEELDQAKDIWLGGKNCFRFGLGVTDTVIEKLGDIAHQLSEIRTTNSPPRELYESRLGKWIATLGLILARSDYYMDHYIYFKHRNRVLFTYFADLVRWQVPEQRGSFPATNGDGFRFIQTEHRGLRMAIRHEELFVRRLMDLLIEQHAVDTGLTRHTIIENLRHEKAFRFSAHEDTFNRLYSQASNETIARVVTEWAYHRAWALGCAAVTTMYDVATVANAPALAEFPSLRTKAEAYLLE